MAISTYKVFLMMESAESKYEKLIDIKDFPDLGGSPEMLETTTLSDASQTYIHGIDSVDGLEFTANYTKEDYAKLLALKGQDKNYSVWLGGTVANGVATPTGDNGKFNFSGQLSVVVNGGGVNEVVGMTISIAPSSAIVVAE